LDKLKFKPKIKVKFLIKDKDGNIITEVGGKIICQN